MDQDVGTPSVSLNLGTVGTVRCEVQVTSAPWAFADTVVLSVGPELPGSLGRVLAATHPDLDLSPAVLGGVRPDAPLAVRVSPRSDEPLERVVLATLHTRTATPSPDEASAIMATTVRAALALAVGQGARRLAVPLFGAGSMGVPVRAAAWALVPALVEALGTTRPKRLQSVVLVVADEAGSRAVQEAYSVAVRPPGYASSAGSSSVGMPESEVDGSEVDAGEVAPAVAPGAAHAEADVVGAVLGPLAGGMSADLVLVDGDDGAARDDLGVSAYVEMMATVISRTDTPMPLSIGLFGAWGSGKSTFMRLLRQDVEQRTGPDAPPDSCRAVRHIVFNAWTYSDANLWASLGDTIFRELVAKREPDDGLAEAVAAELDANTAAAATAMTARDRAVSEAARVRKELDAARAAERDSLASLGRAAAGTALGPVWSALGVRDEGERGRMLVDELRASGDQVGVLRRTVAQRRARAAVALVVVSAVLVGVSLALPRVQAWWPVGAVGVAGGLAWFTKLVTGVRSALTKLADAATTVRRAQDANTERLLRPTLDRLEDAQATVMVTQAQLDRTLDRAADLRTRLAELQPGPRLYGFLSERAGSDDYRGRLGLISLVRRDLVELSRRLTRYRQAHVDKPAIDRIVLYIDDLDRCEPRQVVDVLQAVHLLLALDLFVVVVGVDPRWLLRSLRQEYRRVLAADGAGAAKDGAQDDDEDREAWRSTPSDYLEKIFNVPFTLPPMTPDTFATLMEGLAGPRTATGGDGDRPADDPSPDEPAPDDDAGPGDAAVLDLPAATAAAPTPPTARPLGDDERDAIAALAPLVTTPRQAKRLLNLYRMLRSTPVIADPQAFLGGPDHPGDYRAVAVLLGLLTADPAALGAVLFAPPVPGTGVVGGVCRRAAAPASWDVVLTGLVPRGADGGAWTNDVATGTAGEAERWTTLAARLRAASGDPARVDVAALCTWGPRVARFSFHLSTGDAALQPR